MPTRISAGVGDHPCFFYSLFIWFLLTVKLLIFSLYLFVSFLKDYHNYFLVRT